MSARTIACATLVLSSLTGCESAVDVEGDDCLVPSNPDPVFTAHLTDLSLHSVIHPMGAAWAGGIHHNGHTYLQIRDRYQGVRAPVYAPVDSRLERVLHELRPNGSTDWAMVFRVSCEVTYILTHVTDPSDRVRDAWSGGPVTDTRLFQHLDTPIEFAAGEAIGHTEGTVEANNWDFGVYHTHHENDFINADRFRFPLGTGDFNRILNSVCPYDFFTPPLRDQYLAMLGSILTDQPEPDAHCRSGSRDVPGTVAGSWFRISGSPALYHPEAGIASEFGGHVILGGIGPDASRQVVVRSDVDPASVTDTHCWDDGGRHVFLRLQPDGRLNAAYGEGGCPAAFPVDGFGVYER